QVRPQQCWHDDCDRDQQSAHRRRTGFFLMSLRAFFANVLSNLKFAEPADDQRSHNERGEQRGKTGERSAECQVAEDAEGRKIMLQLQKQQPVEQSASDPHQRCLTSLQPKPTTEAQSHGETSLLRTYHLPAPAHCSCQVSSAFSSFTPREAFSSTTSPSRDSRASHCPASSAVARNSAAIPDCRALSTIACASPRTPIKISIFFSFSAI